MITTHDNKRLITLLAIFLLLTFCLVYWRNAHQPWRKYQQKYFQVQGIDSAAVRIRAITPTLTGQTELCLTCHIGIEEISPSHPVQAFGCTICHGGEPMSLKKELAHQTLRGGRNPSDFQTVEQSCGRSPDGTACHSGYDEAWHNMIDRDRKSLQATAAGAIAHTRYTFGWQKSPFPIYATRAVQDDSALSPHNPKQLADIFEKIQHDSLQGNVNPAEAKFVKNCLTSTCHLNTTSADKHYFYRASGCAACHYLYSPEGKYEGKDVTINRQVAGHGTVHRLSTAIPFSQCNHCHNRGIYSMKQMRFIDRDDLQPDSLAFLSVRQKRRKEYYIPLAQYSKCEITLDCIDCHTHNEIMGNGHILPDKKAAIEIACQTCHGTVLHPPQSAVITSLEQRDVFIAQYNPNLKPAIGDTVVVTPAGTLLPAVRRRGNHWEQVSKVNGEKFFVPQVFGSNCKQDPHKQDSHSCHKCHDLSEKE